MKKYNYLWFVLIIFLTAIMMTACKTDKETLDVPTDVPATQNSEQDTAVYNDLFAYKAENDAIQIIEQKSLIYKPEQTEIALPEEIDGLPVKTIGKNAFYQYKDTRSFVLPQNLLKIESCAFYRCYLLQKMIIPKNVELIESEAFFRCSSLTEIEVDEQNLQYCSEDGVLFNKNKTVLHTYPEGKKNEKYIIPSSVTEIGDSAFGYHCAHLKEIVIGKNVTVFPDYNIFVFPDDITLRVDPDSAAEQYAKTHHLHYQVNPQI